MVSNCQWIKELLCVGIHCYIFPGFYYEKSAIDKYCTINRVFTCLRWVFRSFVLFPQYYKITIVSSIVSRSIIFKWNIYRSKNPLNKTITYIEYKLRGYMEQCPSYTGTHTYSINSMQPSLWVVWKLYKLLYVVVRFLKTLEAGSTSLPLNYSWILTKTNPKTVYQFDNLLSLSTIQLPDFCQNQALCSNHNLFQSKEILSHFGSINE